MTDLDQRTRTTSVTGPAPGVNGDTIVDMFHRTARANRLRPALRWRTDDRWDHLTWREYEREVTEVAAGLGGWELRPGDRVAILATNRPEWHVVDMAILSVGLVSVPVYPTNAASQIAYILRHSGSRVCFVEDVDQLSKVLLRRVDLPDLEAVVVMASVDGLDDGFVRTLAELRKDGAARLDAAPELVDRRRAAVVPEQLATLVYTSGTTGPPKGAMITHANVMATMRSLRSFVDVRPDDRFLSFLPLSHITERSISHFGQISGGAETWFARSFATVADDLRACRPTLFFAVPRVWEKFREGIVEHVHASRGPVRVLAHRFLASAADTPAKTGARSLAAAAERAALDGVVGRAIRRQLGLDRARILACGAAPVAPDLLRWFHRIGLPVAEGYGQTEVSLSTSFNRPSAIRIGTVGPPVPGVSVRIAPDGEILVRGDNVCAGYWRDQAASAELVDADGWLHTGDLGQLDPDGYLSVTGRKKDLIITAYGKNISPEEIETRLRMEPIVSQAVVVGDGRPYLTALLTLDAQAATEWAEHESRALDMEALTEDPDLRAKVERTVQRANAEHSHAEGVRRWRLLPHDLTLAAGELTPTLKVKRNVVVEHYGALVEEMYAPEG
jgi:long-chain acyl-CoA synthetase